MMNILKLEIIEIKEGMNQIINIFYYILNLNLNLNIIY